MLHHHYYYYYYYYWSAIYFFACSGYLNVRDELCKRKMLVSLIFLFFVNNRFESKECCSPHSFNGYFLWQFYLLYFPLAPHLSLSFLSLDLIVNLNENNFELTRVLTCFGSCNSTLIWKAGDPRFYNLDFKRFLLKSKLLILQGTKIIILLNIMFLHRWEDFS